MRESATGNARGVVVVAAVVSIAAFFLSDPLALGLRKVDAITGSFAAVGLVGLVASMGTPKKR